MSKCNVSEVLQALEQLSRNELLEMISGQLSVPHAEQTKLKLVHFILENGSADLLQNLKERAQKRLGKRKEQSPGDITSHKRRCLGEVR